MRNGRVSNESVLSQNTTFLPSLSIVTLEINSSTTLYVGVNNLKIMMLRISDSLTTINGEEGNINISVSTSSANLTIQPTFSFGHVDLVRPSLCTLSEHGRKRTCPSISNCPAPPLHLSNDIPKP